MQPLQQGSARDAWPGAACAHKGRQGWGTRCVPSLGCHRWGEGAGHRAPRGPSAGLEPAAPGPPASAPCRAGSRPPPSRRQKAAAAPPSRRAAHGACATPAGETAGVVCGGGPGCVAHARCRRAPPRLGEGSGARARPSPRPRAAPPAPLSVGARLRCGPAARQVGAQRGGGGLHGRAPLRGLPPLRSAVPRRKRETGGEKPPPQPNPNATVSAPESPRRALSARCRFARGRCSSAGGGPAAALPGCGCGRAGRRGEGAALFLWFFFSLPSLPSSPPFAAVLRRFPRQVGPGAAPAGLRQEVGSALPARCHVPQPPRGGGDGGCD